MKKGAKGVGALHRYITILKPKELNLQGAGIVITEDGGDPRVGRARSAQAGAWGALGGGLAGGIGGYFGKVNLGGKFQWGTEGQRALAHGVAHGGVSELRGGKFGAGFAAGFFSSFAGSRVQYARVPGYIGVPVGGVVGGLSSRLGGGSFEDGFAQGLAVNAYNHWGDDLARFGKGVWEKTKLYGGAVIDGVRSVPEYWRRAIVDPNAPGSGVVAGIESFGEGAIDLVPGFITGKADRKPENIEEYGNRWVTGNSSDHHAMAVRQAGNHGHYYLGALGGYVSSSFAAHIFTAAEPLFGWAPDSTQDIWANYQGTWNFVLNYRYPGER